MISLTDYIKEKFNDFRLIDDIQFKHPFDWQRHQREISEMLSSCSIEHLMSQINKKFSKIYEFKFEDILDNKKSKARAFYMNSNEDILKDNKFFELINKFNYYITETRKIENQIQSCLEPIFARKLNNYVYDDCDGIIYRLINKNGLDFINKHNGLIVSYYGKGNYQRYTNKIVPIDFHQEKTNKSRDYTSRLFFFCAANHEALLDAADWVMDMKNLSSLNNKWIIKIDLKKYHYNIDCYEDTYSNWNKENSWMIYINGFFPKSMIQIYDAQDWYDREFEDNVRK